MLKDNILAALEENKGNCISGETLASRFNVSRTAIWKNIRVLQSEGFCIETLAGKGYCLSPFNDKISIQGIRSNLKKIFPTDIYVYDQLDSTNSEAMRKISAGAPPSFLVTSEIQTNGKGRRGRAFYSPKGSGIYMSLCLSPNMDSQHAVLMTTAASLAAVKAIYDITGKKAQIKWVNDIFLNGLKIGGILTEAVTDFESGQISSIIVGIGINCTTDNFDSDLATTAGALCTSDREFVDRNLLIARITDYLTDLYYQIEQGNFSFIEEYKAHSMVIGKKILLYKSTRINDEQGIEAVAEDIDSYGGLIVKYSDGTRETISTGEISLRLADSKS